MKEVIIKSNDDYSLSAKLYEIDNPKAVIQVIHGMAEHQDRYKNFATFLSENGFIVVTSDLRGHGKKAKDLGYFKDKNGYKDLINDQIKIREYIEKEYPNKPIYLFGHSMGTIISRVMLQTESKHYDKVILCGYPNYQSAANLGITLASIIKKFKGPKHKSKLLQNITTGTFNKKIKNPRTNVDWLSYNENNVNDYIKDEYSGYAFTTSAYSDLFHLLKLMHKHSLYQNVKKELPFLLISGEDDPCTGGQKGTQNSINTLKKAGFENIEKISYKNMRHEILNEKDNTIVFNDVLSFIEK